ncbi:MAG: hypothetical protein U0T75_13400 [Chitinophagales bacterium]
MELSLSITTFAQNILKDFEHRVFSSRDCEYAYDFYYNQIKDHLKEVQSLSKISNLEEIIHAYNIGLDMSVFIDESGLLKPKSKPNFFWDIYENLAKPQTFTNKLYPKEKPQSEFDKGVGINYEFVDINVLIQFLGLIEAEKLIKRKRDYFLRVDTNQSNDKYQNLFKIFTCLSTVKKTKAGQVYLNASSEQVNELVRYIFKLETGSNRDIPKMDIRWNASITDIVILFHALSCIRIGENSITLVNVKVPEAIHLLFVDSHGQTFKYESLERTSNRKTQEGAHSTARIKMNDMIVDILNPNN